MGEKDLYEHYPELRQFSLVHVDVIDNGEALSTFATTYPLHGIEGESFSPLIHANKAATARSLWH